MKTTTRTTPSTTAKAQAPARTTADLRTFQAALRRVASACSADPERPNLWTVQVIASPSRIRLQAADGFRIHRVDLHLDCPIEEIENGVIPTKYLLRHNTIEAILKAKIARGTTPQITLDADLEAGVSIDGRILDAGPSHFSEDQYPDLDYIVPVNCKGFLEVDGAELLQAVKCARVFASDGANICKFYVNGGLVISGCSEENGESWTAVQVGSHAWHDIATGFNCDFLIDLLKQTTGTVRISYNGHTQPVLVTDARDFTAVIMPMFLNRGKNDPIPTVQDLKSQNCYDCSGARAWDRGPTVKHDPDEPKTPWRFPAELFISNPEPLATDYDIRTIWSYLIEADRKRDNTKLIAFHLTDPRPNPDAPIVFGPIWTAPANRHPIFAGTDITIGECSRCLDANHHALIDGYCSDCRQELAKRQ